MTRRYRSRALASTYETVEGFHGSGLMDKQTMRSFDADA